MAMRTGLLVLVLVMVGAITNSAWAQIEADDRGQSVTEHNYGIYYGDGLRHLAEGRYGRAVDDLFRAYGLEPSAHVMELIIDGYDAMGHCDAAQRQIRFFRSQHADEGSPELQRCANTGQLVLDCDTVERKVQINHDRRARCGDTITVPADEGHHIAWSSSRFEGPVSVEPGEQQYIEPPSDVDDRMVQNISVAKLPGLVGHVARLPMRYRQQADVPRLPTSEQRSSYRVYETSEGLYHVWSLESGDQQGTNRTKVEIVCPEDAPGGEKEAECVLLRDRLDQ